MRDLTRPVLEAWGAGCKKCKKPTPRLKNCGNKASKKATKRSIKSYTTRAYSLSLRPFKLSSSANITITFWPAILALKTLLNCWLENITSQPFNTTLMPTSKAITCIWHWKYWGISFMVIFNSCQFQLIAEKTYWWILWSAYPFQLIERETIMILF